MSISQNFPEEGPTLNLNFAGSKTLDPRITFSRTTTGTYMDDSGLIVTAPADSPRFDHRYVNGEIESLGLLVEEQRSNLTKYSNTLQSPFNPVNGTITTNQTTSPSGENNASLLTQTAASTCYVNYGSGQITWTSGQQYTFSCFVKKYSDSDENQIYILGYNLTFNSDPSGANSVVIFNLDTLTSTTADGLVNSHSIDDVGNGWRRISATFTAYTTESRSHQVLRFVDPGATSNMYVWGYQIEEGAFPTSYIPRPDASTATRNPDSVTMTGDNFSDWYNQSEGSFYMNIRNIQQQPTGSAYTRLIDLRGTPTGDNYYLLAISPNGRAIYNEMFSNGSSQLNYSATYPVPNSPTGIVKITTGLQQNNFIAYNFASQFLSDTSSVTLPILNTLYIGRDQNGGSQINGHISKLTYYPTRLSNDQLQNLTK